MNKIDILLDEALQAAAPDQKLRVIVTLDPDTKPVTQETPNSTAVKPLSRTEFRRLAIAQRKKRVGGSMQNTLNELRNIGLTIRGDGLVGAVVVDGTPDQLQRCLELPALTSATLDHTVELERPIEMNKL